MANKKNYTKMGQTKKPAKPPVKPAAKKPVAEVKKPTAQKRKPAAKKQVKVQKVQVSSVPPQIIKEANNTYKIGKYEVKKAYVWGAGAIAVVILLCVLF